MENSNQLSVLICGGGIAGNTLALQLLRGGAKVTVVERADAPRPGGQAVDLRGPSREIAERMELLPSLREHLLDEQGMSYVDEGGHPYARMAVADFDGRGTISDIEIARGDLNQVLLDRIAALGGDLDYRYGDWVEEVEQDQSQKQPVRVRFAAGNQERFDVVVGADGVHSAMRAKVFGNDEELLEHLGGYTCFFTMPTPADITPNWLTYHSFRNAAIMIRADVHPETCKASVTLRHPADPTLRSDVSAQKNLIRRHLAHGGWHAPTIVAAMDGAADFYFDQLARVNVPNLVRGRVVLLGDAGYCGSPLTGMGTAMAILGAYLLAGELLSTPEDLDTALARFDPLVRPFLAKAQQLPGGGLRFMLPKSWFGVKMGRLSMSLILSRVMRPLSAKMFFHEDPYQLPTYEPKADKPE